MPRVRKENEKEKENFSDLIKAVEEVFGEETSRPWAKLDIKAWKVDDTVTVQVSQMYEHLPMTFEIMKKLAEIFGTTDFTINQWSANGCETCDYGSEYAHKFIYKVK